ncbi:MAG: DUF4097 family beta strand repeat-containing protein [Gemmatimonadales bacterium]
MTPNTGRSTMHRITWLALAILMPANALAQIVGRNESSFTATHRISNGGWVRITTPNGTVRIVQTSGSEVQIRADKDVRRGSIEDIGFVVRRSGDALTVCAVYEDEEECGEDGSYRGRNRRSGYNSPQVRTDFTVSIPAHAKVRAGSGNGDVSIDGAGAVVVAQTGNGDIEISNTQGEVEAHSGNGRVTITAVKGSVDASTGNGAIQVATAAGPVEASTGNGSIDVTMDRVQGSPEMRFTTGNGRITIRVPDGFGADLVSSAGSGRVSVDLPFQAEGRVRKSSLRGRIGSGGGRLVLRSGNGNINVMRS